MILKRSPMELGYQSTGWTLALLATHLQRRHGGERASCSTLRRRLHALGWRWKRPRYVFADPDPRQAQKKRAIRKALRHLPAGARVFTMDETALRLLPPLRAAWAQQGKQAKVPISGRNAQGTLYCALNLQTGRRITRISSHQRQGDFHAFLRQLRSGRGPKELYFFPDRLLVFEPSGVGIVSYEDLRITSQNKRFLEEESVPCDSQVVDKTWHT